MSKIKILTIQIEPIKMNDENYISMNRFEINGEWYEFPILVKQDQKLIISYNKFDLVLFEIENEQNNTF